MLKARGVKGTATNLPNKLFKMNCRIVSGKDSKKKR